MTSALVGFQELLLKIQRINLEAPVACAFGLYDGLQEIMVDAKERAPKDTHAMANSGYVTPPEVRQSSSVSIEAGFGGPSADYVVRQHEDMGLNHPNGGEAKFFQTALDLGRNALMKTVSMYVSEYLKSGRNKPPAKKVPAGPWETMVNEHGG